MAAHEISNDLNKELALQGKMFEILLAGQEVPGR